MEVSAFSAAAGNTAKAAMTANEKAIDLRVLMVMLLALSDFATRRVLGIRSLLQAAFVSNFTH